MKLAKHLGANRNFHQCHMTTPSHSASVETQADIIPADQPRMSVDPILGMVHPFPIPSMPATTYTPFDMPARKFARIVL